MPPDAPCPCESGRGFADCCDRFLDGLAQAPTAEALMRSRYAAYVLGRLDYLRATWHPATCPVTLEHDPAVRWLGLQVRACTSGGMRDATGTVEFVARYQVVGQGGGRAIRLHECSRFERRDGGWVYHSGTRPDAGRERPRSGGNGSAGNRRTGARGPA